MSCITRALVYAGRGTCAESIDAIKRTINRLRPSWKVEEFIARNGYIVPDPSGWERGSTLFVMPGGKCSEWDEEIGPPVVEKLRECILGGDHYLGICAGSYFGARLSSYRWSLEETRYFERGLDVCHVHAEGPLYFHPDSLESARVSWEPQVALQRWEESGAIVPVLVLGGPHYIPEDDDVTILAKIVDGSRVVNSVVKSVCGLGRGVFMNWNPGITVSQDDLEAYQAHFPQYNWKKMVVTPEVLEARLANFAEILQEFER